MNKNITILGAGPVGLSLALLQAKVGVQVTLIDKQPYPPKYTDARSIALSHGTIELLSRLGVPEVTLTHAPIQHIHISEQGAFGHTQLHHTTEKVRELGAVVPYAQLVEQLNQQVNHQPLIQVVRPALVTQINEHDEAVTVNYEIGNETMSHTTSCVIHAEGGVYQRHTHILPNQKDYQQSAIIGTVQLDTPKIGWAWERFTSEGPCALLPQSNNGIDFNLVWCMHPDHATTMAQANDDEFLITLNHTIGHLTGKIVSISNRHTYPLGLKQNHSHTLRQCFVGNAAQTLHPVAGQGLNLGLRDAVVLHQALCQRDSIAQAISHFAYQRQPDRQVTTRVTDAMARGFTVDWGLSHIRSGMFGLLNLLPSVKSQVAEQFMYGLR